jgi:hypothetical protein
MTLLGLHKASQKLKRPLPNSPVTIAEKGVAVDD